jgi:hypothetical protein
MHSQRLGKVGLTLLDFNIFILKHAIKLNSQFLKPLRNVSDYRLQIQYPVLAELFVKQVSGDKENHKFTEQKLLHLPSSWNDISIPGIKLLVLNVIQITLF